jgi:HlyD family secretion protein
MSSSSSFSLLKWLLVLGLAAGGAYAVYRYWNKPDAGAVQYRTATVHRGEIIQTVTANGSLSPVRMVEVGSQISGTLLDIRVDFNSKVKAGDVIAQIDPATYERSLVQAEAELANAEAALELARLNFDRANELFANQLISKSEFDEAKVNRSQAEANVKTRQANVDRAKVDLSRTTIYAPIDGIVISKRVEIGQTVAASLNAPTLFVIANDLARMQIEAAVSEADVGGVGEGQTVNFTVDAFPLRKFSGIVRQVRYEPVTNQNVVNYTTIVDVDNRDLKLRPGMTAIASIVVQEKRDVPCLTNTALRFRPPEGAIILSSAGDGGESSSRPSAAPREIATSGPFAGLPVPPWSSERRRPTEEERARYEASLTPEQKEQYRQIMERFRARMAGGEGGDGGAGGGMGRQRRETEGPRVQTVYVIEKQKLNVGGEQIALRPVTVRLGISDNSNTEVLEGLKDGDLVATGTVTQLAADAQPSGTPFGRSPFGGGRPRVR